jgi:hypothetical protein
MAKEDKQLDTDHLRFDIRHMAEYLADIEVGARQGLRVTQTGFREAVTEIFTNQKNYGDRAGISERDFQAMQVLLERHEEIKKYLYQARKLAEVLEESSAVTDDQLQRMVFGFAQIIEARAKAFGDPDILARYEQVRAYRSAVGLKAAKTRRRNEAELEDPQNDELPDELPEVPELPGELPPAVETAR